MRRELAAERRRGQTIRAATIAVGVLTCVAVVMLAIPLSYLVYHSLGRPVAPDVPVPGTPVEFPPNAAIDRSQVLADRGWGIVDRDLDGAIVFFTDALSIDPKNGDANYGLGYSFERQGDISQAEPYLCTAMRVGGDQTRERAGQLLQTHGLTCP